MIDTPQLPLPLALRESSDFTAWEVGPNGALVASLERLARGESGQLFLWGAAGCGRTHLLEACARQAVASGRQVALLDGQLLGQLGPALLEGLEQMALVLVDNLDHVIGQAAWDEALFHLYNRCRDGGTAMVFSALGPPAQLPVTLPDLASRLAAGPVFRIQPLADAELERLLQMRAHARGLEISDEVARFIVARCQRSPGQLMARLAELDQAALASQRRLTVPFVKAVAGW